MENSIPVSVVAFTLFMAMILNLAAKPRYAAKLNGILILVMGAGALVIYGTGFATNENTFTQAVLRTLLAVCGIYTGNSNTDAVANTWFATDNGMVVFWIVHIIALYATASTAIAALGSQALQKIRLLIARWGELNLIYGINSDSVEFGKSLLAGKKGSVVYIDDKMDANLSAVIAKSRCVLCGDDNAVKGNVKFLHSIGIRGKKRKITLYALSKDSAENLNYARAFLTSLKEAGITPEKSTLVILGREDSSASSMQVLGENYGYGAVTVFNEASLVARLLILNAPPCDQISFGKDAKASEDFEVLQVGFGRLGQEVLRQLVMNGQFEGSTFHAAVFAPDCESQIGYFANRYLQVLDRYDISFHPFDARSRKMYEYILERREKIKYVVLCTGSEKINREVAEDLAEFFEQIELKLPIHLCSYSGITTAEGGQVKRHKLYQEKVLSTSELDLMASLVNDYYCNDSSKTAQQHWKECNYFNRMSNRGVADFAGAFVRAAGKTEQQVLEEGWNLSESQMENQCRTEHLRWCAFHYCMGYSPMTDAEFDDRAEKYKKQLADNGKATIRIAKNTAQRTHACLVSWEELVALSEKEKKITGKDPQYQLSDKKNVLLVPKLLKQRQEMKKS